MSMSWWNLLKMSDEIELLVDQLDDNEVVEISGTTNANEIEIIVEIPIDPRFIEWMSKTYKIDLISSERRGTRNKYKIQAIGV